MSSLSSLTSTLQIQPGLLAILGPPPSPSQPGNASAASTTTHTSDPEDLALHARIFYYARRVGVNIDFAAYRAWLAAHPEHVPPQILPPEYRPSSEPALATAVADLRLDEGADVASAPAASPPHEGPAWQASAPKQDLFVRRGGRGQDDNPADGGVADDGSSTTDNDAQYPHRFAEIMALVQAGKPVPGIREIPDRVERDAVRLSACWSQGLRKAMLNQAPWTRPSRPSGRCRDP